MRISQPLLGIQNSVMAFTEPFADAALSNRIRRTGEGFSFPVQDGCPSAEAFCNLVHQEHYQFLVQHVMPDPADQAFFIEAMAGKGINYILGNEFGSINGPYTKGTNRYDLPSSTLDLACASKQCLGLIYDESEHAQLHPDTYDEKNGSICYQWTNPRGKNLEEIERAVSRSVRSQVRQTGIKLYSEHVFPVMYHTFARAGMNLIPKVLKEEFQSLQLATALGAAVQYRRDLGICVDLWGMDVGEWFTRTWGFPGHSPLEFENALKMSWHFAPSFLFVENIDPLFRYDGQHGFSRTEFGEIYARFIRDYVPRHPLPYTFRSACADIALVRSDDALVSDQGGFSGYSMYGSRELGYDKTHTSVFKAWHALSHGAIPDNGLTWFLPQFDFPKNRFPVTPESVKRLPKPQGEIVRDWENRHGLFYPLKGVLVFDDRVRYRSMKSARLIVAAGSRMRERTMIDILRCVHEGATLLSVPWLLPDFARQTMQYGDGRILVTQDFGEDLAAWLDDDLANLIGDNRIWTQRFGNYELCVSNPSADGVTLDINTCRRDC